ncbi:MAG: hypothetical protein ACYCSF_00305 [Acidimicrobiales bacterium]
MRTRAGRSLLRLWVSRGDPNGPPIVAGSLVWAISTGADGGGPSNVLYGMSPVTGKVLVTEQLGQVEPFVTPAAANGEIVVGGLTATEPFGLSRRDPSRGMWHQPSWLCVAQRQESR